MGVQEWGYIPVNCMRCRSVCPPYWDLIQGPVVFLGFASGLPRINGFERWVIVRDVCSLFSGKQLFHLIGHQGVVRDLAFTPNGSLTLVSGSRDKTLRIWDLSKPGGRSSSLACCPAGLSAVVSRVRGWCDKHPCENLALPQVFLLEKLVCRFMQLRATTSCEMFFFLLVNYR